MALFRYREGMAINKHKGSLISIRIEPNEKDALEKEGKNMALNLTSYIRYLLHTHPMRPHNKGKK